MKLASIMPSEKEEDECQREHCRPRSTSGRLLPKGRKKVNTSLRGPEFCNHEEENFVTTGRNAKFRDSGQAAAGWKNSRNFAL